MEVNPVDELQPAKERAHLAMSRFHRPKPWPTLRGEEQGGSRQNKEPAEPSDAPWHEETSGVKRATVDENPGWRQDPRGRGWFLPDLESTGDQANDKRGQQ